MRIFEEFIKRGEVKKTTQDINLANALKKSAEKSLNFVKKLAINEENSEHIVQDCYDIMRELIEAKLASEGYKSYSHEATILFLKNFSQFTEQETDFLDNVRKTRNKIKYYGKESTSEEAKIVLEFMNKILPKLKELTEVK